MPTEVKLTNLGKRNEAKKRQLDIVSASLVSVNPQTRSTPRTIPLFVKSLHKQTLVSIRKLEKNNSSLDNIFISDQCVDTWQSRLAVKLKELPASIQELLSPQNNSHDGRIMTPFILVLATNSSIL